MYLPKSQLGIFFELPFGKLIFVYSARVPVTQFQISLPCEGANVKQQPVTRERLIRHPPSAVAGLPAFGSAPQAPPRFGEAGKAMPSRTAAGALPGGGRRGGSSVPVLPRQLSGQPCPPPGHLPKEAYLEAAQLQSDRAASVVQAFVRLAFVSGAGKKASLLPADKNFKKKKKG